MSGDMRLGYRYPLRLHKVLMDDIRSSASRNGQTMREYIEEAVIHDIRSDTAKRTDFTMAPLIAQLIRDSQRSSAAGLRKVLVRIALELPRME